jgi:RNA polymerase sigma factor (sigma-70 family)
MQPEGLAEDGRRPAPSGEPAFPKEVSEAQIQGLRQRLTAVVAQVCPFWLAHEREDLVQSALIKIVGLHGGTVRRIDDLKSTYLWKTAHSVTLDEIRRARWKFERTAAEGPVGDARPSPHPDPERAAASREVAASIRACLTELETSRRHAVVLHLAGFGRTEVAELLRRSVKQIDNLVHRGTRDLRGCLESKGVRP